MRLEAVICVDWACRERPSCFLQGSRLHKQSQPRRRVLAVSKYLKSPNFSSTAPSFLLLFHNHGSVPSDPLFAPANPESIVAAARLRQGAITFLHDVNFPIDRSQNKQRWRKNQVRFGLSLGEHHLWRRHIPLRSSRSSIHEAGENHGHCLHTSPTRSSGHDALFDIHTVT